MRAVKFACLATFVAISLCVVRTAHATSPYTAIPNDATENMENDSDTFTPTDTDPLNDPAAGMGDLPPGADATSTGLPYGSPGEDWGDARTGGGNGIIEEVPSGFAGTAAAPDGSAHVAIVQFDSGDGPFGRTNRDRFNGPTTGPAPIGNYWATLDLYIDGSIAYGGADGIPDFWWTNAVNENVNNSYMSESGATGTVDPGGATWTIATTNGVFLATVPVGTWIGLEMQPIPSVLNPGLVAFEHRVYADGGTHNVLIGTTVVEDYVAGGLGGYAELAGPRYNWFTFPGPNMTHIFVDNAGWAGEPVPEPSTVVLAGLGALGLAFVAKRRRAKA